MNAKRNAWNSTLPAPTRGLKRSPMKRKTPRRIAKRKADASYVAFVRGLDCIRCHAEGPSEAAHMPIGTRGMGLKSTDTNCVPLCRKCHGWFDGGVNPHATKVQRRGLAVVWVAATKLAAIPTTLEEAWALRDKGLGEVLKEVHGAGWAWIPSWGAAHTRAA